MCGIAGAFARQFDERLERCVRDVIVRQRPRGPDFKAVESVGSERAWALFGHNRLSIIDLSAASNQPLWDHEHRTCIIFNGEIYNYIEIRQELVALGHTFVTAGDTEVILEAFKEWGPSCLEKFLGMFAFALFDRQTDELWLVRDRYGVKPLLFRADDRSIVFASTGAVIADTFGLDPNMDYLLNGIEFGLYESETDMSPYHGLLSMRPGHWLRCKVGGDGRLEQQLVKWYDLEERVASQRDAYARMPVADAVEAVRDLLHSAVNLRLRSDVPVGVALSGGVDSSSIAGVMAKSHPDVYGFTWGHPSDPFGEGKAVQTIVDHTGIRIVYCSASGKALAQTFWDTLEAQDAPFTGDSKVAQFYVAKVAREHGVIVLLGGQGGDEAFMGYLKFRGFAMQDALRRRDLRDSLLAMAGIAQSAATEIWYLDSFRHALKRYINRAPTSSLLARDGLTPPVRPAYNPAEPLWVRQARDVTRYSLPTLLRYEDRNSAGNSLEARLPFLDHRLVELGLALPEALKVRWGYGKWVLREAARGLIPESVRTARRKRWFSVNQKGWVRAGLGAAIRERLHDLEPGYTARLREPLDIEQRYSDDELAVNGLKMPEALGLIWLGRRRG